MAARATNRPGRAASSATTPLYTSLRHNVFTEYSVHAAGAGAADHRRACSGVLTQDHDTTW